MMRFKIFLTLVLILTLFCAPGNQVLASTQLPGVIKPPPQPPQDEVFADQASAPISTTSLSLPALKAVLVVGDLDCDPGMGGTCKWTNNAIEDMRLAETVLRANGVTVYTFYYSKTAPHNNNWADIKTAANGANFFLYNGHGIEWNLNPLIVGGIALSNDPGHYDLISNDQIRNELHLAKNAIVMVYACYAAGSYGGEVNLTSAEAQNRVYQFADPYFDIGAAAYYSSWFGNAYQMILTYLFAGQTFGQAFESYGDYNPTTVERYTFPGHSSMAFWLDKDYYATNGVYGWKYRYAFAGLANSTLQNLYGSTMVSTPTSLSMVGTKTSSAQQRCVTVYNDGNSDFTWSASISNGGSWLIPVKMSGVSGECAKVTLNPAGLNKGTYTATLNISTSTPGVAPKSESVPVTLIVVSQVYQTFLPISLAP